MIIRDINYLKGNYKYLSLNGRKFKLITSKKICDLRKSISQSINKPASQPASQPASKPASKQA